MCDSPITSMYYDYTVRTYVCFFLSSHPVLFHLARFYLHQPSSYTTVTKRYVCMYVCKLRHTLHSVPHSLHTGGEALIVRPDLTHLCMYVPTYIVVCIRTYMCITATKTFPLSSWPFDCLLACGSQCLYAHTDNDILCVRTLMLHAQSSLSLSLSLVWHRLSELAPLYPLVTA